MELVKNIFFNTDKLIANSTVKVSYTGELFQNGSEKVFIHYGFGNSWDKLAEVEMQKTELGFQAEIKLDSEEPLNLCFRNSNNEWDNNYSNNYSFEIENAPTALALVEQQEIEYPRRLRKTYIWSKKIKLALYRIFRYFPKLVSGNYKKEVSNDENN